MLTSDNKVFNTSFEKKMTKEFDNFDKIEKFFSPTNEKMTNQEKFDYIKNHFRYNTMNSWNNSTSFANNVKIHNLGFTKEQQENYNKIFFDENFSKTDAQSLYDNIDVLIYKFQEEYTFNFSIGFNGRSGGYLVLYKSQKVSKRIQSFPGRSIGEEFQNYETYEEFYEEEGPIDSYFELVYDFDLMCDIIRYCFGLDLLIETEEVMIPQPDKKIIRFKE